MRINTNVAALNSYNQLKNTQSNLSKSLERLSSGKRINKAADDAAGLAISEKMKSQTRGLAQAQRNAQDGISMIQTAEGALKESHSILQRMRELSVQSSNETNTTADREEIQKEVTQLKDELNRIADTTEFNTKKLLNGKSGVQGSVVANSANGDFVSGTKDTETGTYQVTIDTAATKATGGAGGTDLSAVTDFSAKDYTVNGIAIDTSDLTSSDIDGLTSRINEYTNQTGVEASNDGTNVTLNQVNYGSDYTVSVTGTDSADLWSGSATAGVDASVSVTAKDGSTAQASGQVGSGQVVEIAAGFDSAGMTIRAEGAATNTFTIDVEQGSVGFQIGANKGQDMSLAINEMSASKLGDVANGNFVSDIDVSTTEGSKDAISVLDDAIAQVSGERSKLGSVQNRLDHTINNLNTAQENLTAAESRISDVDMAKEMMNMSKQQILSQAGTAMMAQANQLPQGVLQLLG